MPAKKPVVSVKLPGGIEIPAPRWVVAPLGVLLLVGAVCYGWWLVREHLEGDAKRVSAADLLQLEHANRHLTEIPVATYTLFNDARGSLSVRYYGSDNCTLVERHMANGPVATRFLLDLGGIEGPAKPVRAASQPALTLGAAPAFAAGSCIPPERHGAPAKTWNEGLDGCQVRVWRAWSDGCTGYSIWNSCGSYWSAWTWTKCVH